eukprot:154150-Pleurochrysis_carterae.AAC.1
MPKAWMKRSPTNTKRELYCERQLRANRSFVSKKDFKGFVLGLHKSEFEVAYDDFVLHDPDAPTVCKDDFK